MGQPVKKRLHYRGDAIKVHAMLRAIEEDEDADPAWRAKVMPLLQQAIPLLLSPDCKLRKAG